MCCVYYDLQIYPKCRILIALELILYLKFIDRFLQEVPSYLDYYFVHKKNQTHVLWLFWLLTRPKCRKYLEIGDRISYDFGISQKKKLAPYKLTFVNEN